MRTLRYLEESGTDCSLAQRHIPEERDYQNTKRYGILQQYDTNFPLNNFTLKTF